MIFWFERENVRELRNTIFGRNAGFLEKMPKIQYKGLVWVKYQFVLLRTKIVFLKDSVTFFQLIKNRLGNMQRFGLG